MASASKDTPKKEYVKWKNVDYCCLRGSTNNPDKFTNVFSAPGKRKKLVFKIKVTLSVNICGEGSLWICRVCERKLNNFTDFVHTSKPILESVKERASSKRCLNFSPVDNRKRADVGDSDENNDLTARSVCEEVLSRK